MRYSSSLSLLNNRLLPTQSTKSQSGLSDKSQSLGCHACREAAVCGFDIAVSAVDPDDKYIIDFFHILTDLLSTVPAEGYTERKEFSR